LLRCARDAIAAFDHLTRSRGGVGMWSSNFAHALSVASLGVVLSFSARAAGAQTAVTVSLPDSSIRAIAADFDAGRNPIYCFYGTVGDGSPSVHVERVSVVASPAACDGIGIGFISRIDDRAFLGQTLHGLIDGNARFRIVSAFYRIEIVQLAGHSTRAPRAMSIVRGAARAGQ
jgi:hypothetical protein